MLWFSCDELLPFLSSEASFCMKSKWLKYSCRNLMFSSVLEEGLFKMLIMNFWSSSATAISICFSLAFITSYRLRLWCAWHLSSACIQYAYSSAAVESMRSASVLLNASPNWFLAFYDSLCELQAGVSSWIWSLWPSCMALIFLDGCSGSGVMRPPR